MDGSTAAGAANGYVLSVLLGLGLVSVTSGRDKRYIKGVISTIKEISFGCIRGSVLLCYAHN